MKAKYGCECISTEWRWPAAVTSGCGPVGWCRPSVGSGRQAAQCGHGRRAAVITCATPTHGSEGVRGSERQLWSERGRRKGKCR